MKTFYCRNGLRIAAACPTGALAFMKSEESQKRGRGGEGL
jgi:hypothetical protein